MPLVLDITNKKIHFAAKKANDVTILINNAGTAHFGTTILNDMEFVVADMNTNYFGSLQMIRAFVPVLKKNGEGLIANVNSGAGLAAFPVVGSYSASKAALHSLTQSVRAELAEYNIHVVGIYPGPIDTDMARDFPMEKASPESTAELIVNGLIAGDEYIFPDPMSKRKRCIVVA